MKLRFAPSPTGFLHVGGARTAIFNLLHARRYGGSLLLRIEDTDVERSRQRHAEQIISSLQWLGVTWDEGPLYQSERLPLYRQRAADLVQRGAAYRCYCTVEELEVERVVAEKAGIPYRYSGRCRSLTSEPADVPHIVRFRVNPGAVDFHDLIRGDVHFDAALLDDFVLLRSDGYPTYHLSVVVDDIDMGITLVARGDDHLSNTPKHILLFRALGAEPPQFAHLPLILGPDRKRLSKRTGATSAEEYRDMGIVPQALFNFLTLLGWSPGGDRELFTMEQAASMFDLSDVNAAPAIFDAEKLLWMNGQYLMRMSADEIHPHLIRFLDRPLEEVRPLIDLHKTRSRTLREMAEQMEIYFVADDALQYEPAAVQKHVQGADLVPQMGALHKALASAGAFDAATTERALRDLASSLQIGAGKLIHPLRLALTGKGASPPIFDVAAVLGKERTLRRLQRFIERLPELASPA